MEDELGRAKEELARNVSAEESAPFAAAEEAKSVTAIRDERSTIEPQRRYLRESTGTNAPETGLPGQT